MATNKTVLEQMYEFQTKLQGVANDLAIQLSSLALGTDLEVTKLIVKGAKKQPQRDIRKALEAMQKLIAKIRVVRGETYKAAEDLIFSTAADVALAATNETSKEFQRALANAAKEEREKRFCKTLTQNQLDAIIDGQGISGATIRDWFHRWTQTDMETITRAVQQASVEEMSVSGITKLIRGTADKNYTDGILHTTRVSAVRMARTIINGVSNNARVETIKANQDVIDGIKFIGTLDGKTCPYCGSLDGYIWRGDEMGQARRPPIHPNCRCTLIPYVELKDADGNPIDLEGERPAANADFDALAKEAYNDRARKEGWNRRWDDLSQSTRLKYYYQAQKDYESRTGTPAYSQVPASLTFAEYFQKQPVAFKRSWLGGKRFELYEDGRLTEKDLFAPDLSYRTTASALFDVAKKEDIDLEELGKLTKEKSEELKSRIDKNNVGKNGSYTHIKPEFEGTSDVEELRERWKNLSADEVHELRNRITEAKSKRKELLDNNAPNRDDYSDAVKYDEATDLWRQDIDKDRIFWEAVGEALPDLKIDVEEELSREPINDSKEFIERINNARSSKQYTDKINEERKKRGLKPISQSSKQLGKKARKRARKATMIQYLPIYIERISAEHLKLDRRNWAYKTKNPEKIAGIRYLEMRSATLKNEEDEAIKKIGAYKKAKDRWREERENDRISRRAELELMFPDKGGKSFFTPEFRKNVLDLFDRRGEKKIAEDVLEVYDLIARTYNTSGRTIDMPNVSFARMSDYGSFSGHTGDLKLSIAISGVQLRRTFAHELGHWLGEWGCGYERVNRNSEWLYSQQKYKRNPRAKKYAKIYVPSDKNPYLGVREDGYSQRVYLNDWVPRGRGTTNLKEGAKYDNNELMSTGLENLCVDPEIFALRCPQHFNLVLDNFGEL